MYQPHDENINGLDHLAKTSTELLQVPIATCPEDRRNQILLTTQLFDEITSELPLVTDGP
jgi:hypothetical protein